MRALLLMCIGAALVAAAVSDNCPECDKPDPATMAKLDENAARLNRLVARAVDVSDTIKRRQSEYEDAEVQAQNMLQRLEKRNGVLCKGQFVCGGAAQQCADNLVVCDGVNDCDNGADEATDICNIKAKVGDSWVGSFVYHNCSSAKFSNLRFELKKFERKPNMMSLADVSAMLFWDDNTDADVTFIDSLPYDGTYKFYSRSAHFEINYGGQLFQEVFYFIPGETNIMHYDVYFANSQKICARAYLKKT